MWEARGYDGLVVAALVLEGVRLRARREAAESREGRGRKEQRTERAEGREGRGHMAQTAYRAEGRLQRGQRGRTLAASGAVSRARISSNRPALASCAASFERIAERRPSTDDMRASVRVSSLSCRPPTALVLLHMHLPRERM